MGKFIGGPSDGRPTFEAILEIGSRYNVIPVGEGEYPRSIYERVPGTDDFVWVITFDNDEEYGAWQSVNPNQYNYF